MITMDNKIKALTYARKTLSPKKSQCLPKQKEESSYLVDGSLIFGLDSERIENSFKYLNFKFIINKFIEI